MTIGLKFIGEIHVDVKARMGFYTGSYAKNPNPTLNSIPAASLGLQIDFLFCSYVDERKMHK